ncbi:hypothetical protein JCM17846_13100 [Iodidimonas nitroreducens]|uniref:Uncharacterized protein n=1 Tax=Iodidimonas nitroreducens TaxID=1236968 RepID=A0A5A7N6B4_9PROT|nr:hypothetical protein [Iodidimonas nitroreducens]GER03628.1 hypothetical protein JCM17846_13100 [Iodidimonas nitroreducens]
MTRPPSAIDLGDLFRLNPALDRPALARQFVEQGERIQINDILSPESAARLYQILGQQTPWGIAYYDGAHHFIRREEIAAKKPDELAAINSRLMARARHDYSYFYFCYPMLQAYLEQWQPDHLLMRFLEFLNSAPMLDLIREISGLAAIIKRMPKPHSIARIIFCSIIAMRWKKNIAGLPMSLASPPNGGRIGAAISIFSMKEGISHGA